MLGNAPVANILNNRGKKNTNTSAIGNCRTTAIRRKMNAAVEFPNANGISQKPQVLATPTAIQKTAFGTDSPSGLRPLDIQ